MTADQYLQLGEDPPGVRLELVDGEITANAGPPISHIYALTQLPQFATQIAPGDNAKGDFP